MRRVFCTAFAWWCLGSSIMAQDWPQVIEKTRASIVKLESSSGFICTGIRVQRGLVITVEHCAPPDPAITLHVAHESSVVIARGRGVALLGFEDPSETPPMALARMVLPGSPVFVGGFGFDLPLMFSFGHVAGWERGSSGPTMQLDAVVMPGYSGAPVISAAGELVGLVDKSWMVNIDQYSWLVGARGWAVPIWVIRTFLSEHLPQLR